MENETPTDLLDRAMRALTARMGRSSLTHPNDKSAVVNLLHQLRERGVEPDPADFYSRAIADGWGPDAAQRLQEIIANVIAGKRVRTNGMGRWKPNLLD